MGGQSCIRLSLHCSLFGVVTCLVVAYQSSSPSTNNSNFSGPSGKSLFALQATCVMELQLL